jgi:hypothetical protein
MRWFKKPIPREGENRRRRKFLWLPLTIDHETRWLEYAVLAETVAYYRGGWWWRPFQFINEESDK